MNEQPSSRAMGRGRVPGLAGLGVDMVLLFGVSTCVNIALVCGAGACGVELVVAFSRQK